MKRLKLRDYENHSEVIQEAFSSSKDATAIVLRHFSGSGNVDVVSCLPVGRGRWKWHIYERTYYGNTAKAKKAMTTEINRDGPGGLSIIIFFKGRS